MEDHIDVIVVGAGLAGSAAAYQLAQSGLQVVMVERGPYPGSKNLSGGVLFGRILHQLIPNFWEEAPVERYITRQVTSFLTDTSSVNIDFQSQALSQIPYNGFSVLRAKFDRWLAGKAEEAGAMLVPGIRVDRLVRDDQRIIGVQAGDEEITADVVIAADGANSFLAREAGLQNSLHPGEMAIGIKELIGLSRETIEDRFGLTGDEGAAYGIVGSATGGVPGGGFLYTNKDSLSIGIVAHLDALVHARLNPNEVLENFLAHPMIAPLIRGGRLLEYGAHLVIEGGIGQMPRLFTDGMLVVGDAAGFSLNTGFVVRGMDLAIASGVAAAQAVLEAHSRQDFSASSLAAYLRLLDQNFIMADMHTYAKAPGFLKNDRIYKTYPGLLVDIMNQIYIQDARPKQHLFSLLRHAIQENHLSLADLAVDGWRGVRNL